MPHTDKDSAGIDPVARICLLRGAALAALVFAVFGASALHAQESTASRPAAYSLFGVEHIYQDWNNCGPATLTMALTYYTDQTLDQHVAANWLKPNYEDKNVSPWQMAEYVNTQLGGNLRLLVREGGDLEQLKTLIANDFPVLIEEGYDPPGRDLGWMGHYLLMSGYDDNASTFLTQDSYEGPNYSYTYDHINEYWRHFNRLFLVLYPQEREAELMALLGSDADTQQNWANALAEARAEAVANPNDPFAWFNMGTSFVGLGMDAEAAVVPVRAVRGVIERGPQSGCDRSGAGQPERRRRPVRGRDVLLRGAGPRCDGRNRPRNSQLGRRDQLQPEFHPGA
jgi:hypothetical protein